MISGARGRTGWGAPLVQAIIGSSVLRVIGMGLGFLIGVQLARGLGPEGYGVYGIAVSVIALIMVPTEFGLPQLVTREVASAQSRGDAPVLSQFILWCLRFVLVSGILFGAVTAAIFALDIYSPGRELKSALYWGALLLPVVAVSNILSAGLRGLHRIIEGQIAELLIRPAFFSMMLFVVSMTLKPTSLTPWLAMALSVAAAAFGALFAFDMLRRILKPLVLRDVPLRAPANWRGSAVPLALGEGMRILSGHLAILILGFLVSESEVGIYRVALGVYVVATLPSALLNSVCSPKLAALHQEGRHEDIQRLNNWMTMFLLVTALFCFMPFAVAGESILSVVFGEPFSASNSIVIVFLVGEIVASLLGHPTIVLNMMRHERAVMRFSALALAVNLVVCIALVPAYGGEGAAVGVAISHAVWRASSSWYAWRRLGLNTSILAWRVNSAASIILELRRELCRRKTKT